jgi:hypothetical protein
LSGSMSYQINLSLMQLLSLNGWEAQKANRK